MASEIRSHFLEGPAGKLEALLNVGEENASHAAMVCHPHPLYGGTMHNKVVFNAMKALSSFGFPVLRFNFRGAGLSEGPLFRKSSRTATVLATAPKYVSKIWSSRYGSITNTACCAEASSSRSVLKKS